MNIKTAVKGMLALALAGTGLVCAAVKVAQLGVSPPIGLLAAEMTMPTGTAPFLEEPEGEEAVSSSDAAPSPEQSDSPSTDSVPVNAAAEVSEEASAQPPAKTPPQERKQPAFEASLPSDEELAQYAKEHEGEAQYPVYEFNTTLGNCSYEQVQVKNNASTEIDIAGELKAELGFQLSETDRPQVLIYHTHTSESYLTYDTGYFYESYYSRSSNQKENVCAVGEEIAKQLNAAGIVTLHDTTVHDDPSYSGAYDRSLATIKRYLKKYPTIKVVLDIHRDGIGTDEEKSKPVFTANGRQSAQVMVLAGYNADNCEEFRDWEYNLRFALRIQNEASSRYPNMMRPLYFADFMYNMDVNTGSLLIEVGSESNTVEEARYAGFLLGEVLSEVLKKEISRETEVSQEKS